MEEVQPEKEESKKVGKLRAAHRRAERDKRAKELNVSSDTTPAEPVRIEEEDTDDENCYVAKNTNPPDTEDKYPHLLISINEETRQAFVEGYQEDPAFKKYWRTEEATTEEGEKLEADH